MPLEFKIDVRGAARHRIEVVLELEAAAVPRVDGGLELFMPAWTPGSYLIREHARHVEAFAAADAKRDTPIAWRKTAKNRFRLEVPEVCRRARVTYRVYGHELTVRTSDFTDGHAYWNGACVYLWPVGGEKLPAGIEVSLPGGWRLATQLPRAAESPLRLEAADLDAAVDAPCLAGALDVREFEAGGRPHAFAFDGLEGIAVPDSLLDDARRLIEEAARLFGGELPYERYQFLALFADAGRGGLEHASSCTLLAPRTTFRVREDYESFTALVAHEFFHVWNGKRMRPTGLWTIDYERECYTTLLWVTEGFTAYYDDRLCLRAGVIDGDRYLKLLGETISAYHRTPGRLLHPLAAASFDAWIKLYRPDEHSRNSTQSYYSHGALAALCFDLHIRARTAGQRSLDDAVRELYRLSYAAGRGFDDDDVVAALSAAAGEDLAALKAELIDGPLDPDFDRYLEPLGLALASTPGTKPELGVQFAAKDLTLSSVLDGSAAAAAGLSPGDEILALAGLRVTRDNWGAVLQHVFRPGEPVEVLLCRRGRVRARSVLPALPPADSFRIEKIAKASRRAVRLRQAWLCEPSQ